MVTVGACDINNVKIWAGAKLLVRAKAVGFVYSVELAEFQSLFLASRADCNQLCAVEGVERFCEGVGNIACG